MLRPGTDSGKIPETVYLMQEINILSPECRGMLGAKVFLMSKVPPEFQNL